MPDYKVLKEELLKDPLGRNYASMTDDQAATDLNTPYRTLVIPQIPLTRLAVWAAKTGVRAKIESAALELGAVQSICLTIRDLLTGLNGPPLDLSILDNLTMVDGLVAAGVMTKDDKVSLLALQDYPLSRAMELVGWGISVQAPDIEFARAN